MKKYNFSGDSIYAANCNVETIDIDKLLVEFHNHKIEYDYSHFIRNRWENIYLSPALIPAVLPIISYIIAKASVIYEQSLVVPHELLGFNQNEFWFNSAKPGESTSEHMHNKEALISGVLYLQVPDNSGNLFFKKGKKQELEVPAEKGKLVLFPSQLDHYVPENQSRSNRISFSFNCFKFPLSQ